MKKIIEKLYRGELCDMITGISEIMEPRDGEEIELLEKLTAMLNEEQLEVFRRYNALISDRRCAVEEKRYIQGFKTGLLIGVECIDGASNIKSKK